jgi:hypothetical protein
MMMKMLWDVDLTVDLSEHSQALDRLEQFDAWGKADAALPLAPLDPSIRQWYASLVTVVCTFLMQKEVFHGTDACLQYKRSSQTTWVLRNLDTSTRGNREAQSIYLR